ncbi:putative WRKY transcription factor 15 [Bidens hawaiensis]|uniref:putative WRKY transcription factor 15 n=1 Tax=Bidens hawaiensis TaxID=980011 RepID=UPI0040498523
MAVDLITGFRNTTTASAETAAVQEAASGLESVQKLIRLLSQSQSQQQSATDYEAFADMAVTKFKCVISLLDRPTRTLTGHARFRRGPVYQSQSVIKNQNQNDVVLEECETKVYCPTPIQQARNSFVSSVTGETENLKPELFVDVSEFHFHVLHRFGELHFREDIHFDNED